MILLTSEETSRYPIDFVLWGVDRAAKTYFVDNLLAGGIPSTNQCTGLLWQLFSCLQNSDTLEVRILDCVADSDVRSRTGSNLRNHSN